MVDSVAPLTINRTLWVWLHLLGTLPLWLAFVLLHFGSFHMLCQIHWLAHGMEHCVPVFELIVPVSVRHWKMEMLSSIGLQ